MTLNALRLVLGTLTILPVRPPERVDRRVAGWAMALAPLVGAPLAVPALLLQLGTSPVLEATLVVAALTLLTRALHLDGLADTADGLGSRQPPAEALRIMKQSDIGPFGVVAVILVLLLQVAAIVTLAEPLPVAVAIVVSRGILPLVCTRWFPAARGAGLGAAVAGTVGAGQAVLALILTGAAAAAAPYSLLGLVPGLALALHCRRRLGGLTGDVYGAVVEVTLAAALVAMALLG